MTDDPPVTPRLDAEYRVRFTFRSGYVDERPAYNLEDAIRIGTGSRGLPWTIERRLVSPWAAVTPMVSTRPVDDDQEDAAEDHGPDEPTGHVPNEGE